MGYNQGLKDKIAWIKEHYDCVTYAWRELGWPVHKDGDRYISVAPGSENTTALIVHSDTWHDFKTGYGGDVIDLCAWAKYNGDKGSAIRELGRDYKGDWNEGDWQKKTQQLCNRVQYWHECLRPEDREYLHSRHIVDETIERLKLGFDSKSFRLTVPYFKNGYAVYAAGRERMPVPEQKIVDSSSGELIDNPEYLKYKALNRSKYQKMALDGYNENVPWGLHTLSPEFRRDKNMPLVSKYPFVKDVLCILEGMFDVMSFEQEGFICLSPIGGYFNEKAKKLVINTARQFKRVFICFDNDLAGTRFNIDMAKLMFEHRIPFIIGRVPVREGIKDVSDYYCDGGALAELVKDAEEGITALARKITDKKEFKEFIYKAARYVDKPDLMQLFEDVRAAHSFSNAWLKAVASECLKAPSEKIVADEILQKNLIRYAEGVGFFVYDKAGYWRSVVDNGMKGIIAQALGNYANGGRLNTMLNMLKSRTTTQEVFNRQEVVNFPNGVLDLKTGELKEHTPSFMTSTQMKYNYMPGEDCPKWKKFIAEVMDDNESKILLIQEMAGYILFPDSCLQKCFFLQGEGANGKSVVINVLIQLFGEENCSSVPMSLLASQFDPIRLHNSWVNFMSETDTNIKDAEARFKAIVAGDRISAAYKGKDAIEFNPRCTMVSACNKFVTTSDTTRGFIRRIIFIGFNRTFEGKSANKHLTQELLEELPGIFNWVYEGYKRLRQNMEFTQTQENIDLMNDYVQIMDPVEAFYNEETLALCGAVQSKELYTRYSEWCKSTGHTIQSRQRFARNFKLLFTRKRPYARITRDSQGYLFDFDTMPTSSTIANDDEKARKNSLTNIEEEENKHSDESTPDLFEQSNPVIPF